MQRTEINAIADEVLELLQIQGERSDVARVLPLVYPDVDLGGPIDDAEPASVRVPPLAIDLVEQPLEADVVLGLLLQRSPLTLQRLRVLLVRAHLLLQLLHLFEQTDRVAKAVRHNFLELGDGKSKATGTAHEYVLGVCLVQLKVGGGVDGGNVLVREGQDSVAGLAAARLDLLKQKRDCALGVVRLPSDGDSETGVEGSVQSEPSVGVLDDAHEGRAIQRDDLALVPLDNNVVDVEGG